MKKTSWVGLFVFLFFSYFPLSCFDPGAQELLSLRASRVSFTPAPGAQNQEAGLRATGDSIRVSLTAGSVAARRAVQLLACVPHAGGHAGPGVLG